MTPVFNITAESSKVPAKAKGTLDAIAAVDILRELIMSTWVEGEGGGGQYSNRPSSLNSSTNRRVHNVMYILYASAVSCTNHSKTWQR